MPFFRKRPVVIEAVQWTGDNFDDIVALRCDAPMSRMSFGPNNSLLIQTLEGTMQAHVGDWIIKGVQGEYLPVQAGHLRADVRARVADRSGRHDGRRPAGVRRMTDEQVVADELGPAAVFDANGRPLNYTRPVQLSDQCTVGMAVRIARAIVYEERWHRRFKRWLARARRPDPPAESARGGLYR